MIHLSTFLVIWPHARENLLRWQDFMFFGSRGFNCIKGFVVTISKKSGVLFSLQSYWTFSMQDIALTKKFERSRLKISKPLLERINRIFYFFWTEPTSFFGHEIVLTKYPVKHKSLNQLSLNEDKQDETRFVKRMRINVSNQKLKFWSWQPDEFLLLICIKIQYVHFFISTSSSAVEFQPFVTQYDYTCAEVRVRMLVRLIFG